MRILHYFLGFPPYRSGGMTSFAYDLMNSQIECGNYVIALWPGRMNFLFNKKKIVIKHRKKNKNIDNYEIINPLPISLDEGIEDVKMYMETCDYQVYLEYLKRISPDVIHIHTLMGLHKEFLYATKVLNIKTIFTSHDYFGICPKVILYRDGLSCQNDDECKECVKCNYSSLSINKIRLMQSKTYRRFKNSLVMRYFRKRHRKAFFDEKKIEFKENDLELKVKSGQYKELRKYYLDMLKSITTIHFNSTLTRDIYLKYVNIDNYKVISISNKDINDNRDYLTIEDSKIRFTYLASNKPYKGIYFLKSILDQLYSENVYDFELNVYCDIDDTSEYMSVHKDGFKRNELSSIFSKTDMLIAPSIWCETFGYTVLEALSFGVPVIVSENVGSKDLVDGFGLVYRDDKELMRFLLELNKNKISEYKKNIREKMHLKIWKDFCSEMQELYEE